MATCTPPTTHSPGFLFVRYTHNLLVTHTARWAFIVGVDITDTVNLRIEANRLAAAMADALTNHFEVTDWGILDQFGDHYYEEPFASAYTGTKGAAAGAEDYYSKTITLTGRGNATSPGVCSGQTRSVLFVGNTYQFAPFEKRFISTSDVDYNGYRLAINASTYLPADEYGQQVDFRVSAPVQFNAHTQKRNGC